MDYEREDRWNDTQEAFLGAGERLACNLMRWPTAMSKALTKAGIDEIMASDSPLDDLKTLLVEMNYISECMEEALVSINGMVEDILEKKSAVIQEYEQRIETPNKYHLPSDKEAAQHLDYQEQWLNDSKWDVYIVRIPEAGEKAHEQINENDIETEDESKVIHFDDKMYE